MNMVTVHDIPVIPSEGSSSACLRTVVEESAVWPVRGKAGFSTQQDHPHSRMILLRSK
jgi:hypothetical protein